jgi:septum formation protein
MPIDKLSTLTLPRLCLASSSRIRADILQQAGLDIHVIPAIINEDLWKTTGGEDPAILAQTLAHAKASDVRSRVSDEWIIGCDQVIHLNGSNYSKPRSKQQMKQQLATFAGNEVSYVSGLCLYRGNTFLHKSVEVSYVQFHNMTDNFIHSFVEKHHHDLGCAGVVPMEGVGIQVVAGLRGSMFSIMGLPVYKLLKILRGNL